VTTTLMRPTETKASAVAGPSGMPSRRVRARRRRAVIVAALVAAVVALFLLSMMLGSSLLSPVQVALGLVGLADGSDNFIVQELRLPRSISALLIGLALGAAGTLFQRVLRNPLASPDFLGVAAGASTATVAALVLGSASGLMLPVSALGGAIVTATVIFLLAWRRGVSGFRFVLVGIGVAAFAQSITSYLIARAEFSDARAALTWLVGSVGYASEASIVLLVAAVVALAVLTPTLTRRLSALELGDDLARGLGARVQADRVLILGAGVLLVAVATAAAGPIAFVALLAGPVSFALLGRAGPSIPVAAAVGAILMQVADLAAQYALPWPVSTGIITGFAGAPYIAWLLISSNRRGVGA
jgi:iron complex transport system permease protein